MVFGRGHTEWQPAVSQWSETWDFLDIILRLQMKIINNNEKLNNVVYLLKNLLNH